MSDPADFPTFSRLPGAPWQHGGLHAREWLLTDGRGGYACGTALDLPTRRYHGWLCAPIGCTARRTMLLGGADERCVVEGIEAILTTAWWHGQPVPDLSSVGLRFTARPWPTWIFQAGRFTVRRELLLPRDGEQPGVAVRWTNLGDRAIRLNVSPWLCGRDADALRHAGAEPPPSGAVQGACWQLHAGNDLPPLWLSVDGVAAFRSTGAWYRNLLLTEERDRGYDHVEDRWCPGVLELDLGPQQSAVAVFALGEPCPAPADVWQHAAAVAVAACERVRVDADRLSARLRLTAQDFRYRDHAGRPGILAGFPWFGEWGRDTFLSLPGLTLGQGDVDGCLQVLRGALPFLRDGLLPNIFGATPAESHYGAADAALWFGLCLARLHDTDGGSPIVKQEFTAALRQIAEASLDGNAMLRVGEHGLLDVGSAEVNATWMDARTAAGPVTPRHGQPVEIQALWYSLLALLQQVDGRKWRARRDRAGSAFVERFWLPTGRYLADRWHDGRPDPTVRPNMVIAAALPRSPLLQGHRQGVVAKAAADLLTPRGLRTLSPDDPAFVARYGGDQDRRDRAYHQGTVWPWLLGFYVEAALAAAPGRERAAVRHDLRQLLDGFLPELDEAGLDHVSEVYDGLPAHRPGGAFAQAWSSGELLRAAALLRDEEKS